MFFYLQKFAYKQTILYICIYKRTPLKKSNQKNKNYGKEKFQSKSDEVCTPVVQVNR